MIPEPFAVVIPASLGLGLLAGFVMHRSDFCMAGMFRDLFLFRSTAMLKSLGVLVVASMVAFELARVGGLLGQYPFPLLGTPGLTNLLGGMAFGFGMVLAGGCVVGTLYKMGAGSVLSLTAFAGLLAGSALYAELHPWWSALGARTAFATEATTLPDLFGLPPGALLLPAAAVGTVILVRWARRGLLQRRAYAEGYVQPWQAALVLAGVGIASYILVGMPMGITTAYAKAGAFVESLFLPERVAASPYFQAQGLNYVPPFQEATVSGGAGPVLDAVAAVQFPLIAGIVLGAAASAVRLREFAPRFRLPARQYGAALAGGLIMGLAARMAPACNVWHLLGGLPILALQSLLFVAGLLPGAWIGSRFIRRVLL